MYSVWYMSVEVQAVLWILLGLAGMIFNIAKRQIVNRSSQGLKVLSSEMDQAEIRLIR
jgi:hypothetical protein